MATIEQQRALSLARARRRRQEEQGGGLISDAEATTAMGKGVAGMISFPRTMSDLAGQAGQYVGGQMRELAGKEPLMPEQKQQMRETAPSSAAAIMPSYDDVYGLFKRMGLPDVEAKDRLGQYQQTIIEFMSGNPSRKAVTTLANILSGVFSETAGGLAEGTDYETAARVGGAVMGGAPVEAASAMRSKTGDIVRDAMEGVSPADIEQARALQQSGKEIGVPLMGAEAIDSPGLQRLASDVAASKQGNPIMEGMLKERPGQVTAEAKRQSNVISSSVIPEEMAQRAERVSAEVIEAAEDARTEAVNQFYKSAGKKQIQYKTVKPIIDKINNTIDEATSPELRNSLKSMKREINRAFNKKKEAYLDKEGLIKSKIVLSDIPLAKLDSIRKDFRDRMKQQQFGEAAIPKNSASVMNSILTDMRKTLAKSSTEFVQGNELFQKISREVIDPLMASGLGKVAGKGFDAQSVPKLERALSVVSNYKEVRPATIRKVAEELGKIDKDVFPQMVRVMLDVKFDKAAEDLISGPQRNIGAKFRKSVYGTPQQKANLEEAVKQSAKLQGKNPEVVWRGFDKMFKVFEATGRIPAFGSPTQPRQQLAQELRSSKAAGTMEAASTAPLQAPANRLRDWLMAGRYRELANILTDENSVEKLIELSKTKPNTAKARAIVSTLVTTGRESNQ